MNPELEGMVAIFWIGQKPRCEVVDGEGDMALTHIVEAGEGQPMRVEDVLAAARRAAQEGRPKTSFLREIPGARVSTIATPGEGVVKQAVRGDRGKGHSTPIE